MKDCDTLIAVMGDVGLFTVGGVLLTIKLRSLNKGPQPPTVLRFLWIGLKGRVVNLSYTFRAPKSKHIIEDPTIIPLIFNKRAPQHILL